MMNPTGPKIPNKPWTAPRSIAEPVGRLNNIINGVKTLRTASSNQLLPSTALLLIYMFPTEATNNSLDVLLSKWKANFKQLMNRKGLQEALNNMDFKVSEQDLDSLIMCLFQTSDGIIDYNNFIQCCAIVEKHLPKTEPPSGSSVGTLQASKPGSGGGQNTNASASAIASKK